MAIDITTDLLAPSGATLKFTEEGQVHRITITKAEQVQATDFVSNEPQTWDDGSPRMQYVISGVSEGEPAKLYLKAWGAQKAAFADALREAGIKAGEALDGGTLTVKWTSTQEPSKPGLSGAKQFKMRFEPAKKAVVTDDII